MPDLHRHGRVVTLGDNVNGPTVVRVPSEGGDISAPAKQIRDPFVFEDEGRAFLFYATCGEQGIAAAEITLP